MIKYYQEIKTKDYLLVDTSTRQYYKQLGKRELEGRATCIAGLPASMATTGISLDYLKNKCKRVKESEISLEYKKYF